MAEMKFGKRMKEQAIESWKIHYMDYTHLKRLIKELSKQPSTNKSVSKHEDSMNPPSSHDTFEVELDKQLIQTSTFYTQKETQGEKKLNSLLMKREKMFALEREQSVSNLSDSFMISFTTFGEELYELKKFAELNVMGFKKIIKKYNKHRPHVKLTDYYETKVQVEPFCTQTKLDSMIAKVKEEIQMLEQIKAKSLLLKSTSKAQSTFQPIQALQTLFAENKFQEFKLLFSILDQNPEKQNATDQWLFRAVIEDKKEFMHLLLSQGNVNIRDEMDRSLLHIASVESLDYLLQQKIIDIEAEDNSGKHPIHTFAERGLVKGIELLLEAGAQLDCLDLTQSTPLHIAASKGHADCVRLLLQKGANSQLINANKKCVIHLAAGSGNSDTLQLIVNTNTDLNVIDGKGQTPLHISTKYGFTSNVSLLCKHNAMLHIQDQEGHTVYHLAASQGRTEILSILLEALSADNREQILNLSDIDGCTALILAAQESQVECTELLLDHGANKDIRDIDGWNACTYAVYVGNYRLAERLASSQPLEPERVIVRTSSRVKIDTGATSSPKDVDELPGLFCKVKFVVQAQCDTGQYVAIVGDRKALGSWDTTKSLPLSLDSSLEGSSWSCEATLPAGVVIKYRYIICQGSQLLKWESLPENRSIRPEGTTFTIDDGVFGVERNAPVEEVYVEEGWLVNQTQIRIRFDSPSAVKLYDGRQRFTITLSSTEPLNKSHQIAFPLDSTEREWLIQGIALDKLMALQFDVSSTTGSMIGRANVHPAQLKSLEGECTCSIVNTLLTTVGEITFRFLVIKPFEHANMSKVLKQTFWRSTALIGHRGGGAESSAKTGRYHRTHIKENTILSFVTAASLGAQYVEFDVHLTKDKTPVIYHDFVIGQSSESEFKVPIHNIPLKQFKKLHYAKYYSKSPRTSRSLENIFRHSPPADSQSERESNGNGSTIQDPFATLEECFSNIPPQTGFNIEIKYPGPSTISTLGMRPFERNEFVDTILRVVFEHAKERPIIFSSFDTDVCLLLRCKQPRYPVFVLTTGQIPGAGDQQNRCCSIKQAIRFAKGNHLIGIVSNVKPLLLAPQLIQTIKKSGLLLATYGIENNIVENAELQEKLGVDAIIADHVGHVSKLLKPNTFMNMETSSQVTDA